ncbi:MAG: BatA and WFA domain-containing protein [Planctomycetes bacterium]|nr:BatA and WFA domain-containing protein [Planctomycetota bacterium]
MNLAAPLGLTALALAVPVVALYLLKVQRRSVPVGYLRLWEQLLQDSQRRSFFERIKRWLSLLLQLVILLALVFALSDPRRKARPDEARQVVLVLDASASMQTLEADGRTRFELAIEAARAEIQGKDPADEYALVVASDRVEVRCPFERGRLRLLAALDGVRVTGRALDAPRALAFARAIARDQPHPEVLVIGDGAAGRLKSEDTAPVSSRVIPLRLKSVGATSENVGILRFSARKNRSLGTDYVLARVKNFGTTEREVTLELSLDGNVQKVLPRTLAPGAELSERLQLALPQGGVLRLEVTSEQDAFALDDVAYALVQPARLHRVIVVAPSAAALEPYRVAFAAMEEVIDPASQALTLSEFAALSPEDRASDLLVCAGALPPDLPPHTALLLAGIPLPSFLPAQELDHEERPTVWDWDRTHLLNRYLNWRDLPLPAARPLRLSAGKALVQSYEGALVAAFDQDGRQVLWLGFDPGSRLFPFRLAFPLLLRNALSWFEQESRLLLRANYSPGEVIEPLGRVPGESVEVSWFPAGAQEARVESLPVREGRFRFAETQTPGPVSFRISRRGPGGVLLSEQATTAINLFEPDESRIAPAPLEAPSEAKQAPSVSEGSGWGSLPLQLWPLLVGLGVLLWTAEWITYHRRWTE